MNRGARALYDKYGYRSKHDKKSFEHGALSLRRELDDWIQQKMKGERGDAFSMGQDDGLQWVLDHLRFIFDEEQ